MRLFTFSSTFCNIPLFLLFAFLFCQSSPISAQLKNGYKALKHSDYESAIKAFEIDIFNTKGDIAVEAEHNLAKIYFDKKYENFNLEQAYEYAKQALARHDKLNAKEIDKIQKKGLGRLMLENHKRQIVNEAYNKIRKEDTYKAYEHFLNVFDGPTPIQFDKATQWRNQRGLDEATALGTWNAYEHFYKKHHESCQKYTPHVDTLLQKRMFEAFVSEWGWNAYSQFASNYPENIYVADSAAAANFLPIATSKSIKDFKFFLMGYPKSPWAKLAIDNIMTQTMQGKQIEDYDYFVRTFPSHPGIEKLWEKYFQVYSQQSKKDALSEFKRMYPEAPFDNFIKTNNNE